MSLDHLLYSDDDDDIEQEPRLNKAKDLQDRIMSVSSFIPGRGLMPPGHISIGNLALCCGTSMSCVRSWIDKLKYRHLWSFEPHFIKPGKLADGSVPRAGKGYRYFKPSEILALLQHTPLGNNFDEQTLLGDAGDEPVIGAKDSEIDGTPKTPRKQRLTPDAIDHEGAMLLHDATADIEKLGAGLPSVLAGKMSQLPIQKRLEEILATGRLFQQIAREGISIPEDVFLDILGMTVQEAEQCLNQGESILFHSAEWTRVVQLGEVIYWQGFPAEVEIVDRDGDLKDAIAPDPTDNELN